MTTTKATYLVTDPCYLITDQNQWMDLLDEHGYDYWENVPCDLGVILQASGTSNGDGYVKVGNGKEITADAGMTCIVRIDNMDAYSAQSHGNAITNRLDVAQNWFAKAQQI